MKTKYFLFFFFIIVLTIGLGLQKGLKAESRLYGIDMNGDGVITLEEWQGNQRTFEERDWNGDGVLSGRELNSTMIQSMPHISSQPLPMNHCESFSQKDDNGNLIEQKRCTTSVHTTNF